jgi:PmbA protein
MGDLTVLAEGIINKAKKKGCDSAEVFIKTAKGLSAEAKNGKVEALESFRETGISLKVIKNQRLGFSFTTNPDMKAGIEKMINTAVTAVEWTAADQYLDIPEAQRPSEVLVMDEKIKSMQDDDVIQRALLLEKSALDFDTRIQKVRKAEVSLAASNTTICNSRGVAISYESSYLAATVTVLASDGQDNQMGWDYAISRRSDDIDYPSVARGASKRAIDLIGAKKISTIKAPVILDPSVADEFLNIFCASLSAEAVQKNRSFLAAKMGKKIMNPIITITDNGLIPWGIGTSPVDDEGVPTRMKNPVSEGILTGFLHNTYTAKKEGVSSTGNASRGSFKNLPAISVTNLYIEPKRNEQEKKGLDYSGLVKSVPKGLLVLEAMGVHTADHISGDFSVGVSGLWIENSEIQYPVKEAVITGNILELFKRVEDVGDDLRFYGKTGSPSILVGEMDISA